jgi:multiple antibiotic resistance protein
MSTAVITAIDWSKYMTLFVGLFAMMNPIGNAAIFLSLTSSETNAAQKKIARTCANAVAIVLIVTVWLGGYILELFGITTQALTVAGGVVVLLIGLQMMGSISSSSSTDSGNTNLGIIPLAIPLIAGPGAMSTILAHTYLLQTWQSKCMVSIVCVGLAIVVGVAFAGANKLIALIGSNGLSVITRIMGLILAAIAIQLLATGLPELFPVLAMK